MARSVLYDKNRVESGTVLIETVLSGNRGYFVGLDRTGHMSFLTGQDRTPKFAGQILPDRTESGLISLNILPTNYRLLLLII